MTALVLRGDARHLPLPDASIDAVVTDPPYGLEFMGRGWDRLDVRGGARGRAMQEWHQAWAVECLRVLKPGGHLFAFGGSRTSHRLACGIEDAGFEMRESIVWLYGQGFPKSRDVAKDIDKAAGATRQVVGSKVGMPGYSLTDGNGDHRTYGRGLGNTGSGEAECVITAPATPDARRWQGWGTALKPAHEPIIVARKPLAGTVAANVLAHGTGALNIDGCRITPAAPVTSGGGWAAHQAAETEGWDRPYVNGVSKTEPHSAGRWPTNVALDESQAAELDRQSGHLKSGANPTRRSSDKFRDAYGDFAGQEACEPARGADEGGASRFFPVFRYEAKADAAERPRVDGVAHETVKPLALMRWLVRLVTPPGGLVLDPFAGSGTTAEACVIEGFRCIAIELDGKYLPLIKARLVKPIQPVLDLFEVGT